METVYPLCFIYISFNILTCYLIDHCYLYIEMFLFLTNYKRVHAIAHFISPTKPSKYKIKDIFFIISPALNKIVHQTMN